MGSPSGSLATLRPDLAGSLMEYNLVADRAGFIAQRVLPVIEVAKASGTYGVIPVEQLLQTRNTKRASGSGYSRGKWTFDDASFSCEEHGAEEPVDDREAELYNEYFDAELVSTMRAYDAVLRNAEIRAAALVFNATTFTSQKTTVTTEWSTVATATPIADVDTAVKAVWNRCGIWPNTLIIDRIVFRNLRRCAEIIDAIEATGAGEAAKQGDITAAILAQVFDLEQVLVAGMPKNSATEGQTLSVASIWDDEYAMVAYIPRSNDIREPGLGRTFHWSADGSRIGGTVESYREEQSRSNIIRVRHDVDEVITYTDVAQLLDNITA